MTPATHNSSFSVDGLLSLDNNAQLSGSLMLQEYQSEISRLRFQNNQLALMRETREKEYENLMFENQTLYNKLENLENVFIGLPTQPLAH